MNFNSLQKINYGLYLVSSRLEDDFNGLIVNTVFQVTNQPATIGVSICKSNLTNEYIKKSKVMSVTVLSEEVPMTFIGNFGFKCGRDIDKFGCIEYEMGKLGVPIVHQYGVVAFEVKIINYFDCGTHDIFWGEVVEEYHISDENPITYDYYHKEKRGRAPKNAPTYVDPKELNNEKLKEAKMKKYVCTVCGYVYDPAVGDPDSGIDPGTAFADIPDEWVCPVCGVTKEDFEEEA